MGARGQLDALGILGVYNPHEYGAKGDGVQDDSGAINLALTIAAADSGSAGVVQLEGGLTYRLANGVSVPAGCLLIVPAGSTLRQADGTNTTLVTLAGNGARLSGAGTIDGNRANNTGGTWDGVAIGALSDCVVEGVTIIGCRRNGITLSSSVRAALSNVVVTDCGTHGIALSTATYCLLRGARAYDNCKVAATGTGDGVNLAATSTDNVIDGCVAYDTAGAAGNQGYGVREAAASACDRNLVVGGSFHANKTGETSFVGASSKRVDDNAVPAFVAPTIALGTAAAAGAATTIIRSDATIAAFDATVPSTQAFGDAAATGAAAVAARRDHKHAMPADPKGLPLALTGAIQATRYVGGTISGAPVAGTFAVGDFVIDQSGKVWICSVAGTPGTWKAAGVGQAGSAVGVTSGPNTTSPTTVDIPEMSVTLTTTGGDLLATGMIVLTHGTNATAFLVLDLDGSGVSTSFYVSNVNGLYTVIHRWPGVAAGSHTVKLRWAVSAGTLTAVTTMRELMVEEVR